MNRERVLIIEDDPTLSRGLQDNFKFKGYSVETANDGRAGLEAALLHKPDIIILDVMLPELNGYEICKRVREAELTMPIIMLTAKGREEDVVRGLNAGAHDYMTKPFSIKELLARAQNLLRREHRREEKIVSFGSCELNLVSHKLFRDGKEVALTPKEFGLLSFFVSHMGRALTRDEIMASVWGSDIMVTPRSVDRCINTLRHKVEVDPPHPVYVKTIRDIGYRFEIPQRDEPEIKAQESTRLPAKSGTEIVASWQVGDRVGRFNLLSKGMARATGTMFEALDNERNRHVWLLALPWLGEGEPFDLLKKECDLTATLAHPGLHTQELAIHDGVGQLFGDLVEGRQLRHLLQDGALDKGRALGVARALVEALLEAHEVGLYHCNPRPEHVAITPTAVVLRGFGLAKTVQAFQISQNNPVLGAPAVLGPEYLAPEIIRGQTGDARSDIFSLGCLMYEMLSGLHPFKGDTPADSLAAILLAEPPDLSDVCASKQLRRIVAHCLEKRSEKRFQSVCDLEFALDGIE